MKIKYEFCYHEVGENYMGVPVGDDAQKFSGMLQLDDVSYDIVSHIKDNISREQLVDEMLDIYESDRETIAKNVDKVLDYLRDNGLLED